MNAIRRRASKNGGADRVAQTGNRAFIGEDRSSWFNGLRNERVILYLCCGLKCSSLVVRVCIQASSGRVLPHVLQSLLLLGFSQFIILGHTHTAIFSYLGMAIQHSFNKLGTGTLEGTEGLASSTQLAGSASTQLACWVYRTVHNEENRGSRYVLASL